MYAGIDGGTILDVGKLERLAACMPLWMVIGSKEEHHA